jgi:uncharacterized protein
MNKTIVIHHSADFDGLFCREIAKKFLPDAELIGWDYGNPTPLIPKCTEDGQPGCQLYMLDISIPELMDYPGLIWIDHHKSAIDKFNPGINGYRIDGVAACRLAWQWFLDQWRKSTGMVTLLPDKTEYVERRVVEPLAVRLAGEYDIWDKRDPRAELFQHGLRSRELTPDIWDTILGNVTENSITVDTLLEGGKVLQYSSTQNNASIIKDIGFDLEWEGLKFLACNHARYNSHLFTAGLTPEHDACFGFKWTGKDWSISLYHAPGKEHHDLSLIAVKHGGGGHRGACGFRTNKLPFLP